MIVFGVFVWVDIVLSPNRKQKKKKKKKKKNAKAYGDMLRDSVYEICTLMGVLLTI